MSGIGGRGILTQASRGFKQIRGRTWLMLGAAVLLLIGLLLWAGISLLSWLWSQAPNVTGAGKRFADVAITQVEQAAPGLREQAEQWLPNGLQEQAEQWVPAGVKEQADKWLPGLATVLPVTDVSGSDIGPVARYPGLVRNHFARQGQGIEVGYIGPASLEVVLAHYVQGFAEAGYVQEVISATAEGEQHRFQRDQEAIDLALTRQPNGVVELRLKQASP